MYTAEILKQKWSEFCITRTKFEKTDPEYIRERNFLLEVYYPLVFKVAEKMSKKIKEVDIDDLVDWGTDGLFHAVHRFDPSLGNKFDTFAIHRIRGSILDNIRQIDWVPRLVRQRNNKLQKVRNKIETELGRTATNEELATALNMTTEEFIEFKAKATPVGCMSMSMHVSKKDSEHDDMQIENYATSSNVTDNPIVREEMFKKLMGKNFIPIERKIIHMHYYENMTMKEISDKLGFSESRISQMHGKIIERLQKKVQLNPEYMDGISGLLQS